MIKLKLSLRNFKFRLILAFGTIMLIAIILISMITYYNSVKVMEKNTKELIDVTLSQTQKSIQTILNSYNDLLMQIYTDDDVVQLIDTINEEYNVAVNRNQLRRTLQGIANVKDDIQAITIITANRNMIFYDKLTAATTYNSWLKDSGNELEDLYNIVSKSSGTLIIPSTLAKYYSAKQYYLFHLAHRIVDYRDIEKRNGVVIFSINADLLNRICNENIATGTERSENTICFIVNKNGELMSYSQEEKISSTIFSEADSEKERTRKVKEFVQSSQVFKRKEVSLDYIYDEEYNWYYYIASDKSSMILQLQQQRRWTVTVMLLSAFSVILIVYILSGHLTISIREIVKAMKKAESGQLSVQVEVDRKMPLEIEIIAQQFNKMIQKLNVSIESEKNAAEKQKNAELKALEAQINPHFLYNMLDMINWMAIDKDEFEISDTINALAYILRYGISNSTGMVTIGTEMEWLKQYILLQKKRLKETFECKIVVDEKVMECKVHKLLFQPFVENAIIHGLYGVKRHHILSISISEDNDRIRIEITDNGKGIKQDTLNCILSGEEVVDSGRNHIGIQNAIGRLQMYYPDNSSVTIQSEVNLGTKVIILIPNI